MSFCNPGRGGGPGFISGNPTNGLCERVCLTVKRVLDGCVKRQPRENIPITLTDISPSNPVRPFTFISCATLNSRGIISNVSIDPIPDSNRRAVVNCTVGIPTSVLFVDAGGAEFRGSGIIEVPISTVMCLPENSVIPYSVEATTAVTCFRGNWVEDFNFIIDCCTLILLKLVIECEMLFPTYGYQQFNECADAEDLACRGFNRTPVFPPPRRE